MTEETDNEATEALTDNFATSDDDTANDFDYFDPDEDQDTETAEAPDAPDDEAEEGEHEAEADEAEAEEAPVVYADEAAKVKLADGTELTVAELTQSRMRQQDYTRKTQELANERKTVQADVERMQRITAAFVDHITALVPDAPPASLALTAPDKYVAAKAQHEAAMEQVQQLIQMGNAPKEIGAALSEADNQKQLQEANARLIEMFPEAAGGPTREAFFNGVQSVANDLGFSNADLSGIRDPRIFALAHWAHKGMAADKAKATAKAKVAAAPPATPRKPGLGARQANGNADAMRNLRADDSFENALKAMRG
jgi:hypothetical protein